MQQLRNRWGLGGLGTTGTQVSDSRVALLLLGVLALACGGESKQSSNTSSAADGGSSCGETCSDFGGNGGSDSTAETSSATGTGGSGSDCSFGGDSISPGCFGSPGPVTNGSATVTGAGGNSSGATDTTSVGTDGGSGSGGAGGSPNCESQDVSGVGYCDAAFGVFFLGGQCGWVSGCSCAGSDCDNGYDDEAACEAAHRECFADACAPQDITLVGGCEPASVYAFNGIECVAMDGCSCAGDDCDASHKSLETCEVAHANCDERELSCDDIEEVYHDYVSHTACSDDSDCTVVGGHCGNGLGDCHYTVNRHWAEAGLVALAEAWIAADCIGGVCDCPSPPEAAVCDDGACVAAQ